MSADTATRDPEHSAQPEQLPPNHPRIEIFEKALLSNPRVCAVICGLCGVSGAWTAIFAALGAHVALVSFGMVVPYLVLGWFFCYMIFWSRGPA